MNLLWDVSSPFLHSSFCVDTKFVLPSLWGHFHGLNYQLSQADMLWAFVFLCQTGFGSLVFTGITLKVTNLIRHDAIYSKQLLVFRLSSLEVLLEVDWLKCFCITSRSNSPLFKKWGRDDTGYVKNSGCLRCLGRFLPTSQVSQWISRFHGDSAWYSDQPMGILMLKLSVRAGLVVELCLC